MKNSFSAFLARVKTYAHNKNETCTFTGSHLRAVTGADDDDDNDDDDADNDNAGRHSTTTKATNRQQTLVYEIDLSGDVNVYSSTAEVGA